MYFGYLAGRTQKTVNEWSSYVTFVDSGTDQSRGAESSPKLRARAKHRPAGESTTSLGMSWLLRGFIESRLSLGQWSQVRHGISIFALSNVDVTIRSFLYLFFLVHLDIRIVVPKPRL